MAQSTGTPAWRIAAMVLVALLLAAPVYYAARHRPPEMPSIPYFKIDVGYVRPPLPYRIVSFHRGRADKNLIKLASQLGFNGVQFQIEGSNENGIREFAARDAKEHLIDYCHSLGMQVTLWVHELSDLPADWEENYLGPVSVDNQKLWDHLDKRYQWILDEMVPKADGLVLTVVETQQNATETPVMLKLVDLIDKQCRSHNKSLIVRTFVWHPEELEGVMGAIAQIPQDLVVMSKIVPQDWQTRGPYAAEIGAVGGRTQIVEWDVAGEYFLRNAVANCMVDQLQKQYDYAISKGAQGICVRVDRFDDTILFEPSEVNLWALGLLAAGTTYDADDAWKKWATYRYGEKAAPAVITALKPTGKVVSELLSVGPFTFGDTRRAPALPWDEIFTQNWQPWRWDVEYRHDYFLAEMGDALFIDRVRKQKAEALASAKQCLVDLEAAKPDLSDQDYKILRTKLITNQLQLEVRTHMILAALHYRQIVAGKTPGQRQSSLKLCLADIDEVEKLAYALLEYPPPETLKYLGKTYTLNQPLALSAPAVYDWTVSARAVSDVKW